MTTFQKKSFQIFQIGLLALPAFFLLYLIKLWFWFLVPLPTNALEYFTGFLVLFWYIGIWKLKFPRPAFSSKWQVIAISLLLLAITIVTVKNVLFLDMGRATPLGIWKGWFIAPACYFIMLVSTFRSKVDLKQLADVTIGIMGITAAVLLIQFYSGWFSDVVSTYDNRLVWPYLDPLSGKGASGNYPALFIAPFLCLSWMLLIKAKDGVQTTV